MEKQGIDPQIRAVIDMPVKKDYTQGLLLNCEVTFLASYQPTGTGTSIAKQHSGTALGSIQLFPYRTSRSVAAAESPGP
jgi:hypothetical protein